MQSNISIEIFSIIVETKNSAIEHAYKHLSESLVNNNYY